MSFLNLDLNLLRVFDEVMAERNLTKAADNLAITQPAVSQGLKRLRESLGDELFIRTAHGVKPTAFAVSLWPPVRDAMAALQATIEPERFNAGSAKDTFRLAMADSTAAMLTPLIVNEIERNAPNVSFRLSTLTTRDPRSILDEGEIDLAIGYFPKAVAAIAAPDAPDAIRHQRLYDGEYVVVMRKGHPLENSLSLDNFCQARHLLVSFTGRPYGFVDETLASIGRKRRVVMTINQFFTAGRAVVESDLLTVLPRHFLEATGIADALSVRSMPFEISAVHVEMLWHRRNHQRASHKWLRDLVVRAAAEKFPNQSANPVS